jgi:hypothetical protein
MRAVGVIAHCRDTRPVVHVAAFSNVLYRSNCPEDSMSQMDFSSWPREQEQSFVVYEQRAKESTSKAFTVGGVVAAIWFVLLVGVYFGVKPEIKEIKGMNMDNLTKKSKYENKAEKAETPAPKPVEAPAAAPAEGDKAAPAEGDKPAAAADEDESK